MICERCNKEYNRRYGSGRFCNVVCARGFATQEKRKLINQKVSKANVGKTLSISTRELISKNNGMKNPIIAKKVSKILKEKYKNDIDYKNKLLKNIKNRKSRKGIQLSISRRKSISKILKEKYKNDINYRNMLQKNLSTGNSVHRKDELKIKPFVENFFETNTLKPEKVGKHWFDFVNNDYIIEYTSNNLGITNAIRRFKTIKHEFRKKYLICIDYHFGEYRKNQLKMLGVKFIDKKYIMPR